MNTLFAGRMSRRSYFIRSILLSVISIIAFSVKQDAPLVYWLIIIVSNLYLVTISVKRLHDIGRKGFLAALSFVPYVNEILMLFLMFKKGDVSDNLYGAVPQR